MSKGYELKEYDLKDYGIELPLEMIGELKFLKLEKGLPIVFLFDEHHGNLNSCIDKNIVNAFELLSKGNVVAVGVESLAGGKSWDTKNKVYSDEYLNKKEDDFYATRYTSNVTKFADEIEKGFKNITFGIESFGMMHVLMEDIALGKYQEVKLHPLNFERSKHFVTTLQDKLKTLNEGNVILNCGSDHNTHIQSWIENGEIDEMIGVSANFIRVNTID